MSETMKIPQDQLSNYFETFTKRYLRDDAPESVRVEVVGGELGVQLAADNVRLIGVTYDEHENSLEFELDSGDLRVIQPREVWAIQEDDGFVSAIEVVRSDGSKDIATVTRREPDRER